MNKQTVFYLELTAEKQAYEEMIESSKKDAKDNPSFAGFFISQVSMYEAKLEVVNEIIYKYLRS